MAIRVRVPGHGVIEFPDGTPQDEMLAALASLSAPQQQQSPTVDAALGTPSTARGALTQAIGTLAAPVGGLKTLRMVGRMLSGAKDTAVSHPIETGALIGGAAAVPLTGGASLVPALAAAGLGGAGGAGLGMIDAAATGAEPVPSTPTGVVGEMAKQGAIQAGAELGGRGARAALKPVGKLFYRYAVGAPASMRAEYPGMYDAGMAKAIPVAGFGEDMAGAAKTASRNAADALVRNAPPATVAAAQLAPGLADAVKQTRDLAVARQTLQGIGDYGRAFMAEHPRPMTLPKVQALVRAEDRGLDSAYRGALDRGDLPMAGRTAAEMGITNQARRVLRDAVPGLQEQNAQTQALAGLEKAINRRVGNMGNRSPVGMQHAINAGLGAGAYGYTRDPQKGLGTFLTLEALTNPTAASVLGIGLNRASGLPFSNAIRAAILARLSGASATQTAGAGGQ